MEPRDGAPEGGPELPGPAWAARLRDGPAAPRIALGIASLVGIAAVSLAWLPAPWVWIGVGWFAIGFLASWLTPASGALWFNLGIVCLVLGLFEANAQSKPDYRFERDPDAGYVAPDDELGYRPTATGAVSTARYFGDELVYEVVYTLDDHHLRIAPPARRDSPCVLFFGGSYMYGEGVADRETLPWQVGTRTGAPVYNFSFHGYGPHHMLAAIETGRVGEAVSCNPTHAIYQAIVDHVNRTVGLAYWDEHGPRYEFDVGGTVVRRGNFDDGQSAPGRFLRAQLQKSRIVKQVSERRLEIDHTDIELFAAVVDRARSELEARYPGISFHAIAWDRSGEPDPEFWRSLERRGITVHRMSEIMPKRSDFDLKFVVGPRDQHPNAHVHARISRYIVERILGARTSPTTPDPQPGD